MDLNKTTLLQKIQNHLQPLKGALSGLRKSLATESTLKMMKNIVHFTSKAFLILKIFRFLS